MDQESLQKIRALEAHVADLKRNMAMRPVWTPVPVPLILPALFNVLGSDVLTTIVSTSFSGVGITGTVPTSVPQLDPSALVTFSPYLGKARYGVRNTGAWVWIATRCDPGTGAVSDTLTSIPNDQNFLSRTSVLMPIAASTSFARVYLPWDF